MIILLFPVQFYSMLNNALDLGRCISSTPSEAILLLDVKSEKAPYLSQNQPIPLETKSPGTEVMEASSLALRQGL